jgi:hypothetical protein
VNSIRDEAVALDTNEFIFALRRDPDHPACEILLFDKLNQLRVYIPLQVLIELQRKLGSDEMRGVLLALTKAIVVDWAGWSRFVRPCPRTDLSLPWKETILLRLRIAATSSSCLRSGSTHAAYCRRVPGGGAYRQLLHAVTSHAGLQELARNPSDAQTPKPVRRSKARARRWKTPESSGRRQAWLSGQSRLTTASADGASRRSLMVSLRRDKRRSRGKGDPLYHV